MGRKGSKRASRKGSGQSSSKSRGSKDSGRSGRSKDKRSKSKKSTERKDINQNEITSQPEVVAPVSRKCKYFGPCKLEARQAHTAILLLQSDEDKIVVEALNDLQKFCKKREENKQIVVDCDGIEAIIKLIKSPNYVIQRISLKLLSLTSFLRKTKLILRDNQMIPTLVELSQYNDDVVVEYATAILAHCTKLYANRMEVIRSGGAAILADLITRADPDIQKNSIETIWHLLEDQAHLRLFTDPITLQAIVKLIDSEYPSIQVIAFTIVERISESEFELPKLASFDILKNVAAKLGNMETADLHRVCLRILNNMAVLPEFSINMGELLIGLSNLLDSTKDVQVLILIVSLFGVLSGTSVTTQYLVDIGVTQKLVSMLRIHANIELREAAVYTVGQFAIYDFRAKEMLVAAIEPIITVFELRRHSTVVCENAFRALSSILEVGHESGLTFLEHDGLRLILKIFVNSKKYSDITSVYAMNCAVTVAKLPPNRRFLVENGLVAGILMVLGIRDLQLLTQGCVALSGLMSDEVGRTQFMEKDGYIRILSALGCPETVVPLAMLPLISVLSKYPEMGQSLIEKGVVKAMSKRQDLLVQSRTFKETLDRLLKLHLPAKFALTGRIDFFEKLEDGFYDQGYLKREEPFVNLRDMVFETRDPLKRVIYLNLTERVDPLILQQNTILNHVVHHKETVVNIFAELVQEIFLDRNEDARTEKVLIGVMATVIASKMGGQADKFQLSCHSEDMELANFQSLYKSTVIPVTMIKNGVHTPRALVFKALADIFDIPCSLDRGGYNKCWNTVMLGSKDKHLPCPCALRKGNEHNLAFTEKLERYVVDLVYQPGSLFPLHSYEANAYCFK